MMVFLDWEKAFDKVTHERLMEALHRLNVPQKIISIITSLYSDPKFKVVKGTEHSDYKSQSSGIRQGCPLSPYLFLLVMTVMIKDIHNRKGETHSKTSRAANEKRGRP